MVIFSPKKSGRIFENQYYMKKMLYRTLLNIKFLSAILPTWKVRNVIILSFLILDFSCKELTSERKFYGIMVDWELGDLDFEGMDGEKHSFSEYRGSMLMFYAGYLNCGTVCGKSMQTLYSISPKIPKNSKIFFLSLDPSRDSRERLNAHADRLGEKFVMIRNIKENLSINKKLEIQFSKNLFDKEINHTDHIYLINSHGRVKFLYPSSHRDKEKILSDIKLLGEM